MLGFSRENLRKSHETPWLVLDLVMLFVLLINMLWLIFDSLFETDAVQQLLQSISPGFVTAYQPIHENFLFVDLAFIALFLSEFVFRWIASVMRKEHARWYFFPFLHWYDLVGCIPLASTRLFRFLRIFSIVYRLHKHKIIDLNRTALFRFITFYADVLVEELSDRIVVKVLSDAQRDIASGSPLIEDVKKQVIAPRMSIVSSWIAQTMNHLGQSIYDGEHGEVIREHVKQSVGKAVRSNAEVSTLSIVPFVGSTIENTLENAVTDIVTTSIINLLTDVDEAKVDRFIRHGINEFTPDEQLLDQEMLMVVNECIELVKQHVSQKRWMEELEARDRDKG